MWLHFLSSSSIEGPINNICLGWLPAWPPCWKQGATKKRGKRRKKKKKRERKTLRLSIRILPPAAALSISSRTKGDVRWIVRVRGGSLVFFMTMLASRICWVTTYLSSVINWKKENKTISTVKKKKKRRRKKDLTLASLTYPVMKEDTCRDTKDYTTVGFP